MSTVRKWESKESSNAIEETLIVATFRKHAYGRLEPDHHLGSIKESLSAVKLYQPLSAKLGV